MTASPKSRLRLRLPGRTLWNVPVGLAWSGRRANPQTSLRDVLVVEPEDTAADVVRRVTKYSGDILFHKRYFDVFTNPSVGPGVETLGIDEVVLYGVALDVCNRYALEGLLSRHPEVAITVVTDAVRAIDENGRVALFNGWQRRDVGLADTAGIVGM